MAAITSNTESWNTHKFSEVETHIKNRFSESYPYNGHDYVEIGGLKWATMNIGANSVTDYGQHFQWGDTTGYVAANVGPNTESNKKPFTWADYKFSGGRTSFSNTGITKYNSADTKTMLDGCDDAATLNWGGAWRMPTTAEFQALVNAVNTAWTADYQSSGVAGLVCTDKTDSSKVLFFPAAGYCDSGSVKLVRNIGAYWSSSRYSFDDEAGSAYNLYFNRDNVNLDYDIDRELGLTVRGVVG